MPLLPTLVVNENFALDLETTDHRDAFLRLLRDRYLRMAQNVNLISSFRTQTYQILTTAGVSFLDVTFTQPFPTLFYSIAVTPDYNTNWWYSLQALGSIRINFGTPTPSKQLILVMASG